MSWVEFKLKELKRLEEYRRNLKKYLKMIKEIISAEDPNVRLFLLAARLRGHQGLIAI